MTPEELTGRLSNQKVFCKCNSKLRLPGLCKKCREETKPYTVFLLCKSDNCTHTDEECGYFWGPGAGELCGRPVRQPVKIKMAISYTADSVKALLAPKYESYYAKLSLGQSPTWKCDKRSSDVFCLQQWIMEELILLKCPDEDRYFIQNFFNRKIRAEDDLYALAAKAINSFLTNTIERYRGR